MVTNFFNFSSLFNYSGLGISQNAGHRIKELINTQNTLRAALIVGIGLTTLALNKPLFICGITLYGSYKIYQIFFSSQKQFSTFLKQARECVSMLEKGKQEASESIKSIKNHLPPLETQLADLTTRSKEIRDLATYSNEELEKLKQNALELYQKAKKKFDKGEQLSQSGQKAIEEADKRFQLAFGELNKFKESSYDTQTEPVDNLKKRFDTLYSTCLTSQQEMHRACQLLISANTCYRKALNFYSQGSAKGLDAINLSQQAFNKIKLHAQTEEIHEKTEKKIDLIKQELNSLEEKANKDEKIIQELQEKLVGIEKNAEARYGLQSLILGGGGGAILGGLLGGVPGAAAAAVAGTISYHNRNNKTTCEAMPSPPSSENPVTYTFNPKSTGLFGGVIGRPSSTVGKVAMMIDEEIIELEFDLKSEDKLPLKNPHSLEERIKESLRKTPSLSSYYTNVLNYLRDLNDLPVSINHQLTKIIHNSNQITNSSMN